MRKRPLWVRITAACLGVLLLALGVAFFYARSIFSDPSALAVGSLVETLGAKSVLLVVAHPDDETLVAGFLADAVKRGAVVNTITATRGEAGVVDPPICRQEDLGIIREAELRKYGYILGLTGQEVWHYPDGKLAGVPAAELTTRIVASIRKLKPDFVLTFEPATGFTMHSDHMASGRAATEAFRVAGDPSFAPSSGAPFAPRFLVYFLAPRRAMGMFGGARGREVGARQMPAQYEISIDPEVEIRGWQVNESQANYLRRQWGLPPGILYRLYNKEDFAVAMENPVAPR